MNWDAEAWTQARKAFEKRDAEIVAEIDKQSKRALRVFYVYCGVMLAASLIASLKGEQLISALVFAAMVVQVVFINMVIRLIELEEEARRL